MRSMAWVTLWMQAVRRALNRSPLMVIWFPALRVP